MKKPSKISTTKKEKKNIGSSEPPQVSNIRSSSRRPPATAAAGNAAPSPHTTTTTTTTNTTNDPLSSPSSMTPWTNHVILRFMDELFLHGVLSTPSLNDDTTPRSSGTPPPPRHRRPNHHPNGMLDAPLLYALLFPASSANTTNTTSPTKKTLTPRKSRNSTMAAVKTNIDDPSPMMDVETGTMADTATIATPLGVTNEDDIPVAPAIKSTTSSTSRKGKPLKVSEVLPVASKTQRKKAAPHQPSGTHSNRTSDSTGTSHTEDRATTPLDAYWLYLSIHCLHCLIGQLESSPRVDHVAPTDPPTKMKVTKKKTPKGKTNVDAPPSSKPHGDDPMLRLLVDSTHNTALASVLIWFAYAITTQLLSHYWHEDVKNVNDVNPDVVLVAEDNEVDDSAATFVVDARTTKSATASPTGTTSPLTAKPRSPKLSHLGKHLIGQLLVLLSQVTTTALTVITTATSLSPPPEQAPNADDDIYNVNSPFYRFTVFAAVTVLDFVTYENNGHPNATSAKSASPSSVSSSLASTKKESTTMQLHNCWKQQSLLVSPSINAVWESTIRPILSSQYQRMLTNRQGVDAFTEWTLIEQCYNELLRQKTATTNPNLRPPAVLSNSFSLDASPTLESVHNCFSRLIEQKRQQQQSSALSILYTVKMDSRVSIKRWASIALVWYRPGQEQLLRCAYNLLLAIKSDDASGRASNHENQTTVGTNIMWETTISRLCDIVHDIGQAAGKYAPTTTTNVSNHTKSNPGDGDSGIQSNISTSTITTSGSVIAGNDSYIQNLVSVLCAATVNAATATAPIENLDAVNFNASPDVSAVELLTTNKKSKKKPKSEMVENDPIFPWPAGTMSTTTTKKSNTTPKLKRPDICDLVMVVSYYLLQYHYMSINKFHSASSTAGKKYGVVINSDDEINIANSNIQTAVGRNTTLNNPHLHVTLSNLATAAAMNALPGNTNQVIQQRIYGDRIEYMVAAWIFMIQESYGCVIDMTLSLCAISKLLVCLNMKSIKNQFNNTSLSELKYNVALPIPSLPSQVHPIKEEIVAATGNSRKRKKSATATDATTYSAVNAKVPEVQIPSTMFAGMYDVVPSKLLPTSSKKTISSMFKTKGGVTDADHSIINELTSEEKLVLFLRAMDGQSNKLLVHLIWIAESCCCEPDSNADLLVDPDQSNIPEEQINSTIDPQNKKRKIIDGSRTIKKLKRNVEDVACVRTTESSQTPIRLTDQTVKVLTAVFSVLRSVLRDDATSASEVQLTLHSSVTTNHLFDLVNLGRMIEEALLFVWNSTDSPKSPFLSILERDNKALWSAVMNFYVTVGKTYNSALSDSTSDIRLDLYKQVARLSKVRSPADIAWPLWLGPSNRVLITATLISTPATNTADLYIVKGMITELQYVAANGNVGRNTTPTIVPDIPLSLYDARIFLVAFSRLLRDDQTTNFVSLLSITETLIQMSDENVTIENQTTLSLVGRLVTLCSNAYCMMTIGASMRDKLLTVVENSIAILLWPPDRSTYSDIDSSSHRYMGILDDWENSELPLLNIPTTYTETKTESVLIERLLNKAFKLGFRSAPIDSCHILFAAWNELGKRNLWGPMPTHICPFMGLPDDLSSILIQLREEMCYVHWMLKRFHHESIPDSTLIRALEKRHGTIQNCESSLRIKGLLRSMIDKATKLIDAVLDAFHQDGKGMGDPVKFCLLEACTVYVAFAISSFTRPNSDFFASTHLSLQSRSQSRSRGYSTDSDALQQSDAGSEDTHDLLFAAVGRVHDVCDCIGAVPAHPDWLDDECHLIEPVSASEAAETALKALTCLTKVIRSGLINIQDGIRGSLGKLQKRIESKSDERKLSTFCLLNFHSIDNFASDINSQLGSLLGIDSGLDSSYLQSVLSLRNRKGRVASFTETKWCPYSSHRIQGNLQASFRSEVVRELNVEELKLCGEWEIMLASRLSSAGINSGPYGDDLPVAEHWLVVCEAVLASLAPTAALLRFSLHSSCRHPHPLKFIVNTTCDYVMEKCCAVSLGDSNQGTTTSATYHDSILSTLVVLSYLSWHRSSLTIASQLVVEPAALFTLQGLVRYAYAIQAIEGLQGAVLRRKEVLSAVSVLVEQATSTIKQWGLDAQVSDEDILDRSFGCLVSCLLGYDYKNDLRFKTILLKDVNPIDALSKDSLHSFFEWDWSGLHLQSIRCLTNLIFDDKLELRVETRSTLAFAMARVFATFDNRVLSEIFIETQNVFVDTLNSISLKSLEKIVSEYVCGCPPHVGESDENDIFGFSSLRESLCTLLAFALNSIATAKTFIWARRVYEGLIKSFAETQTFPDCVMDVTFLYATYFSNFDAVASIAFDDKCLMRHGETMGAKSLKIVYKFVDFVETFSVLSQGWMQAKSELQIPKKQNKSILNNLPSCCSYVSDKDFHGQHWYNCYTCGLINDKGCCTLCAIVCHQGHNIVYARFSSFFCDCGGAEENGALPCKCLSPHSRDTYLKKSSQNVKGPKKKLYQSLTTMMCASIINNAFPSNGVSAIKNISIEIVRNWLSGMFEQSKAHLVAWKAHEDNAYRLLRKKCGEGSFHENDKVISKRPEYFLCSRHSQYLDDFSYFGKTYVALLQVSGHIKSTTSIDHIHDSLPVGRGLTTNALDADSRGRVAVADSNHVKFISGLSLLNSKCVEKIGTKPSLKASLISTITIGFAAKGLKFVADFDNSIYVWGSEMAKVITMTNNLTVIAREMDLAIKCNLDHGQSEIINCRWIVGSGTCIAVGCTYQIFIFDISQQGRSIQPILTISSFADDSSLHDFAVIRVAENGNSSERHWKIFAALENGKLRLTTICRDKNGLMTGTEASSADCLDALRMERSDSGDDDVNSSYPRSRNLYYLEKSNVLIYETNPLNVEVLFLTENGSVSRVATLLPFSFSLNSSVTGDAVTVHGPFTFWNEIKCSRIGDEDFFRAVCVGRLEKSNADVLLSLEFNNGFNVNVEVIAGNSSLHHEFTHSYYGLATYTAPILETASNASTSNRENRFRECIVICALTETGYLTAYVEKVGSLSVPILTPSCYEGADDNQYYMEIEPIRSINDVEHSLNIVSIEDFINITDSDDIIFGGADLGTSTKIKQLLRSESDSFLRSPRSSGCTMIVSVINKQHRDSLKDVRNIPDSFEPADFVVTAIRMFLGCTQKTLPRSITVLGRSYKIPLGCRRWYTFYLSTQDIAYYLRNGFVTIDIDQCHDSSCHPTIDAVEVYALERHKVQKWIPITIQSVCPAVVDTNSSLSVHYALRLCIRAWASLYRILGKPLPNDTEHTFVQQLIADTALLGDTQIFESASFLLSSFEHDEEVCQRSIDNGILSGCSSFLLKMQAYLETEIDIVPSHATWMHVSVIPAIRSCLRTAAYVALLRPFNYPQVVDGSIATIAISIVSACLKCSVSAELVEDFVELSLLESTVVNISPLGRFGSLDGIKRLLLSSNKQIASKIYESISRFCKFGDIFTAQTVAVKYVCDHCLLFINDVRYTVLEKEHGLDLCPQCFALATEYADKSSKNDAVKIDGKNVGELRSLTCEEVYTMEPVPIQKYIGASSGIAVNQRHDDSFAIEDAHQNQLFNDFMDGLTIGISGHLVDEFKKRRDIPSTLIELAVNLIRHSIHSGRKVDRGKELLSSMIEGLHLHLQSNSACHKISVCTHLLEGAINTFVQDKFVRNYFLSSEGIAVICPSINDCDNSKHVCHVHNLPVCRYKISNGPEKDRTFFACSKEPHERCNFFIWTDQKIKPHMTNKYGIFVEEIGALAWQCFTSLSFDDATPLHVRLCSLIQELTLSSTEQGDCSIRDAMAVRYKFNDVQQSYYDGVFCYHGLVKNNLFLEDQIELYQSSANSKPAIDSTKAKTIFVETALEVMSLIATTDGQNDNQWFPVLCRLSSSDTGQKAAPNRIRHLARRSLWKLCGKDTTISVAIRDHYGFANQIEKLLRESKEFLDVCLTINDKARSCLPDWKYDINYTFKEMKLCHMVGTEALVSEDVSSVGANRLIEGILREVTSLAEKRCGSWRRFCGLQKLPENNSSFPGTLGDGLLDGPPIFVLLALICSGSIENLSLVLRVVRLALSRSNDRKSLPLQEKLKEYSNSEVKENTIINLPQLYQSCLSPETILDISIDDLYAFVVSFVYRGLTYEIQKESLSIAKKLWLSIDKKSQATLLYQLLSRPLQSVGSMGKRSTCFLIFLQSAINYIDTDDFSVGQAISTVQSCFQVQRLAVSHDKANGAFFQIEIKSGSSAKLKRYDLGVCSHCHTYFSRVKVQKVGKSSSVPRGHGLSAVAVSPIDTVAWLPGQLSSFSRSPLDTGSESTSTSEFSSFVALKHRCFISTIHIEIESPRRYVKTIKFYFSPRPIDEISVLKSEQYSKFWQQCGVVTLSRDCTRTSYALPTPVIAANLKIEYAAFHEKSMSTKAADGSIIVHCPRCRRVVSSAHGVCASCGEVAFQCRKCRHINYERLDAFLCVECGYCASATFRYDLTAAVATSAVAIINDKDYMVAVNRLRVASQLRDELQSTLKLKLLGLPTQGHKSLGASATIDSQIEGFFAFGKAFANVAPTSRIVDNAIDTKATKNMLSKLGSSGTMVKMIAKAVNYENVTASAPTISLFQTSGSQLERASSSSRTARTSSGSLLREIARDALTISGEDGHDDASATALASELFNGLFDSTNEDSSFARYTYRLDVNDQLRRLLASVQSRRNEVTSTNDTVRHRSDSAATMATEDETPETLNTSAHTKTDVTTRRTTISTITKEDIDLCDKLYHRMCEVECEMYELNRRCEAWRRLNSGCVYPSEPKPSKDESPAGLTFEPSHCSSCGPIILVHLLLLWLSLFQRSPSSVTITTDMIVFLFDTDSSLMAQQQHCRSGTSTYQQLQETKRTIIKEIALHSQQGSKLVLEALRLRLLTLLQDQNAVEILGLILEAFAKVNAPVQIAAKEDTVAAVVNAAQPYVELAHEALQGNISMS